MTLTSTTEPSTTGAGAVVEQRLKGGKLDVAGTVFSVLLLLAIVFSFVLLVILIAQMWLDGSSVLTTRLWDFLTAPLSRNPELAGLGQAIVGTLILCAIVVVVAFPLGIACGTYLEEYAGSTRFGRLTQINVRNLAGVPSIVYGLLGLAVFVKALDGFTGGRSVIAGGLTLALLVLPVVVITTMEALRAVPQGIREGSLAVGATQWETIRSHVLPSAAPGVLTGTVIALARAAGEAAPLLLVGAITGVFSTGDQSLIEKLQGAYTAIPIAIFSWARQPGADFRALTGAGAIVLLVIILILNGFAIWLRNRYEKKW
jgi:phosphate transport system permease protein